MKRFSFLLILLSLAASLSAKRTPPPFLYPVDDGVYRFVVRENSTPDKKQVYKGGHVAAYLKVTGDLVWERYLYQVKLDPEVEQDVQQIYLQQMYLDEPNRLVLQNERGEWFVLDRRNGRSLMTDKFKRKDLPKKKEGKDEDDLSERTEPLLEGNFLVEVDPSITYGHQKIRVSDVPTGRLLWQRKITSPKGVNGGRSHVSLMILDDRQELELFFEDSSRMLLDARTGKTLR
ncbi:MAG TPA: hypothetical protein VHE12_09155 [bacterium]|nr:hypothetical protein [bacterium]